MFSFSLTNPSFAAEKKWCCYNGRSWSFILRSLSKMPDEAEISCLKGNEVTEAVNQIFRAPNDSQLHVFLCLNLLLEEIFRCRLCIFNLHIRAVLLYCLIHFLKHILHCRTGGRKGNKRGCSCFCHGFPKCLG